MPEEAQAPVEEKRRKVRERVKKHRDKKKLEQAADVAANKFDDLHAYWAAQRNALSSDELAQLTERHNFMLEIVDAMRDYLAGTNGTTEKERDEFVEEVKQEVKKKGMATMEITLIARFWENVDFMKQVVERGGPTATFAKYGLLTGIPDHSYHDFASNLGGI